MEQSRLLKLLALWICLLGLASAGTLSEYEGFGYSSGSSLNGQNGGAGWSGAWGTPGGLDATIDPTSLTFSSLAVSGGAVSTAGSQPPNQGSSVATWIRSLGTTLGADNTTEYLSFLFRPDAGFGFYGEYGRQFRRSVHRAFRQPIVLRIGRARQQQYKIFPRFRRERRPNGVVRPCAPTSWRGTISYPFISIRRRGQPEPAAPDVLKTDLDVGSVTSVTISATTEGSLPMRSALEQASIRSRRCNPQFPSRHLDSLSA